MKKSAFVASIAAASLLFGSVGAFAAGGIEKIQAYLNHDITFTVDGKAWTPTDSDGNELAALIYEGSSYVPAKAVAEKMGGRVVWDGDTQTIKLTTPGTDQQAGIPYKDGPSSSSSPAPSSTSVSGGIWSLPSDFDVKAVEGQVKDKAVQLLHLYADALESGDTSGLEKFVRTYSTNETANGWQGSIDDLQDRVSATRSANQAETLKKYAQALRSATAADLKVKDASKTEGFMASYLFSIEPDGWTNISSTWIQLSFRVLDDNDGSFVLNYVNVPK